MAGQAISPENASPILAKMLKMTSDDAPVRREESKKSTVSNGDKPKQKEKREKVTPGIPMKAPAASAAIDNGKVGQAVMEARPENEPVLVEREAGIAPAAEPEHRSTQAIARINDTLDTLANKVQKMMESMNNMAGQMKVVKEKQDFLEASWEDPDFDYVYDRDQGGFRPSRTEESEEGEDGYEQLQPPAKRQKQDGDGAIASSSHGQVANGHVTPSQSQAPQVIVVNDGDDSNSNQEGESQLLGSMRQQFQAEEKVGKPINSYLAKIIDGMLSCGCAQNGFDGMSYSRPANIEFLQKVKVNTTLWSTLSKNARINDIKYQNLHESVMLGMIPLIEVANTCLNADSKKETLTEPGHLFEKLRDSIAVMADVCHEIGLTRRRALKPNVKEQYRSLCGQKPQITTELFGDNLPSIAKDLGEMSKLAHRIGYNDRGGNRGGNRGYNRRGYGNRGRGAPHNDFLGQRQNSQPNQRGRGAPARRPGGFHRGRRGAA